jgi:epoxyqueuosine reductase
VDLTGRVRELALANNLDYVGFASAELLENEPEGLRPSDFLPGANTVISMGVKLADGIQLVNQLAHNYGYPRHLIYPYLWHGFGLPSLHYVDRTSLLVVRLLEKEGYLAVPIMAASTFDIRSSLTEFSNIRAAVAAGLGELGYSNLVLTPDAGPRARFGSIITTARLEPSPPYAGPRLCNPDACKTQESDVPLCVRVCPTRAMGPDTEEMKLGERVYEAVKVSRWRCMWGSMALTKDSLGLKDFPMPDDVGPDDIYKVMGQRDSAQAMELMVIGRGDYCGKCVMQCPVGRSERVDEILRRTAKREEG